MPYWLWKAKIVFSIILAVTEYIITEEERRKVPFLRREIPCSYTVFPCNFFPHIGEGITAKGRGGNGVTLHTENSGTGLFTGRTGKRGLKSTTEKGDFADAVDSVHRPIGYNGFSNSDDESSWKQYFVWNRKQLSVWDIGSRSMQGIAWSILGDYKPAGQSSGGAKE